MRYIDEELLKLAKSDMYPFHMPGHKRNMTDDTNPYAYDITEIDGFDNLHEPEGIIKEAQERAAKLWRAGRSYFLVNGSTCGILAAVSAALPKKGHILMARNCHKAVYHAAYLRELDITYLYPAAADFGIQGGIAPKQVEDALQQDETIQAVMITSPTYDGVVSDIETIAGIAHRHGIPLIVDEAHGAHLGFHEYFPKSAVTQGADVVIQSLHKTLPSYTQTAILHLQSDYVDHTAVEHFLGIYETSSPSYLFMAGIDRCVRLLTERGPAYFKEYAARLQDFHKKASQFHRVQLMDKSRLSSEEGYDFDPSKLVIRALGTGLSGVELYRMLRERHHLQMEMCQGGYVLAMTSIMDTKQGFERLIQALSEIDHMAQRVESYCDCQNDERVCNFMQEVYAARTSDMKLYKAMDAKTEYKPLKEAVGCINGDFVNLYPPGIPMLVPGERITEDVITIMRECEKLQLNVQGVMEDEQIKVVISR